MPDAPRTLNGLPEPLDTCIIGYAPARDGQPAQTIVHLDTIVPKGSCIGPLDVWTEEDSARQRQWELDNGQHYGQRWNATTRAWEPDPDHIPEDFS